jgi:DNA-binding FrmR family transcriptional regulator
MSQHSPADGRSAPDEHDVALPALAPAQRDALSARLRRVEGQIGGLVRMIESGRGCTEVVTQLAAASRALDRVGFLLVAEELGNCATAQGPLDDAARAAKVAALEKLFLTLA